MAALSVKRSIELTSKPGAGRWIGSIRYKPVVRYKPVSQRSRVRIPNKPEFFSGFLFAIAKIASITAMIFYLKKVEGLENSCCFIMRFVETSFFYGDVCWCWKYTKFHHTILIFILISSHFKGLKLKIFPGQHAPGPPQVTHAIKTHSKWSSPIATLITQTTKASPPPRDLPLPALFGLSPRWIAPPRNRPWLRTWQVVFHMQYCHDNQVNHVSIIIIIITIFYSYYSDTEKQNRKYTGNYRNKIVYNI